MPTDNINPEIKSEFRELLVSHEETVKVEDVEGKRVVRFSSPPLMQGHTFAVDLTDTSDGSEPTGPFRIEYVLGTEFAIHEAEAPSCTFDAGYSHLLLMPEIEGLTVSLRYTDSMAPELPKEATLVFKGSGGILQRLIVKTEEQEFSKAIHHTNQIIADFLDAFCLSKRVPISVRHIEVYAEGQKFIRLYRTIPYGQRQLTAADITGALNIPVRLRGALRLFREGLSSNRPPYRLLCLYRVHEVVDKVRGENNREVLARGGRPNRPRRVLPDNELTRCYFPRFVGGKVGDFLDHVRSEYRIPVAHGNLDEYFRLVLDPADVRVDHRVDFTNAALAPLIAEMIQDEIAFMSQNGLLENATLPSDSTTT